MDKQQSPNSLPLSPSSNSSSIASELNSRFTANLMSIYLNLQHTISRQQALLQLFLSQNRNIEQPSVAPNSFYLEDCHQYEGNFGQKIESLKIENYPSSDDFAYQQVMKQESLNNSEGGSESEAKHFSILRRNGFKQHKNQICKSDSNKDKKKTVVKAKGEKSNLLWMNYGQKILEFALRETEDEGREEIQKLNGRLRSKKDFAEIFLIKPTISEDEKAFKILFGNLALFFIRFAAEEAFKDSEHRDALISQKYIVSGWIEKLIRC